jgi:hypothetical protein
MQAFHILEGGHVMHTTLAKLRYVGLFAFLAACLCSTSIDAQPPGKKGKGPKGPPADAEFLTVRGTVKDFTTAAKGEKDGVMLTDGTWVHWPPYLEDRFSNIIAKGDKVKVIGWMETGPKGETKLEVSSLTNLNTNKTVENPGKDKEGGPGPKEKDKKGGPGAKEKDKKDGPGAKEKDKKDGPGPKEKDKNDGPGPKEKDKKDGPGAKEKDSEAVTASGSVREFTTAKKGDVDGFILSDGKWIHWPPHLSTRFADFVVKGDKVRVTGFMEMDKKGVTKVELATLTNLRTSKTVENPDRPMPATDRPIAGRATDREARIRALEEQVEQLSQELKRLRKEK